MTRKIFTLLLAALLLTACGAKPADTPPQPASVAPAPQSTPTPPPAASSAPQEEGVVGAAPIPWQLLREDFPDTAYQGPMEESFPDAAAPTDSAAARHFRLEEMPDNVVETLVAQYFYYNIAADFEAVAALLGDEPNLRITHENDKKAFEEGEYIREYIIHDMDVLDRDDIEETRSVRYELEYQSVQTKGLVEFAVVEAEFSMAYSPAMLAQGPQVGEGRYKYFYLCGTTQADPDWKIYDVYWNWS